MRALVVGGSGQIGGWLLRHLADRGHEAVGTYGEHPFPGLVHLDAADLAGAARLVAERRPEVVFYPAGFTWVDGCEREPSRSDAANRDQPLNLARAAAEAGGRFVSFSTDYVFDGRTGPDSEESAPNPLSAYGRSKLDAERRLEEELGDRALTIRTAWVFGPERQGKNFAYQLVRALNAGKPMTLPGDQVSSPSYGPDVALAAVRLAEMEVSGLIHVAGPETMPRPEFARGIVEGFGLDPSPLVAKPTAELGQGAPRPLRGGLLTPRLDAILPGLMRPLAAAVADFREKLAEPGNPWADPLAVEP
jgi:dTDP-4-dehydrorhamnose reductase